MLDTRYPKPPSPPIDKSADSQGLDFPIGRFR
jgi:hypothetical protein